MRKPLSSVRPVRAPAALLLGLALGVGCSADGGSSIATTAPTTSTAGAGGAGGASPAGGAGGASTSSTSSSSTSSGGAGGSVPLVCTPKYSSVKSGPCDLLQQDCGPGQTCRPWAVGNSYTTKCLANSGLKSRGAPCSSDQECEAQLFCTGNVNSPGQCAPICCPDTDEPCGGGKCNLSVQLGPTDFIMLCTYLTQCTLLTANACAKGTECHLQDSKQGYAACVAPSGTHVAEGQACQYINDCGDMQLCDVGKCRYNCFLGGAGQGLSPGLGGCLAGQTCVDKGTGIEGIGVCQPT